MTINFQYFFIFIILFAAIFELWLNKRQINFVSKHKNKVPEAFVKNIKLKDHRKAADYTVAKTQFGSFGLIISAIITYYLTIGGGINQLNNMLSHIDVMSLIGGSLVVTTLAVLLSVIEIPSNFYSTFVVEEKFGFNKTKPKTFISDVLIDLTTTAAVTFVIMYISLCIISALGTSWWFWLWVFLSSVIIIMSAIGPLLQQLKNKFYPLEDKKLKVTIEKLLKKCGFESQGLFIMNGSLRSSHGNAFFGGFGKTKRIIFFDTLLEKLTHKEIEAVIAHELGHFKMNHVKKFMAIMITILFLSLYVLGGLKDNPLFYEVLGVEIMSDANFLMLFNFVLLNYLFFFIKPVMTFLSRKNEYEADAYACLVAKGDDLKRSLTKLYRDNASTLTPDPLYSSFNHSHPPALMRIKAIDNL
jgi:STE24 endopeptidase